MLWAMHELTNVAFSHYVEKALWALDRFGVPYVEHRYMPLFHMVGVYRAHGGRQGSRDKASSRFSTPVLRTPEGHHICDSEAIVRYASDTFAPQGQGLYGPQVDDALLARLHDVLGPHSRRFAYGAMFERPGMLDDMARHNVGHWQARSFSMLYPVVRSQMARILGIDARRLERSREKIWAEVDWLNGLLSDGRPYLAGDRFSAADLSMACMLAPGILPEQYRAWLPPLDAFSDSVQALVRELREQPAGRHALRMFREERKRVVTAPS